MANVIGKLQREAFVLTLSDRIAEAPRLDGYTVRLRNEHEIEVEVAKEQGLNKMFAELSARSLQVSSMRTKTNRLEELFMRLVETKKPEERRA
jgi:ABC-2 type transport system ATP-binding protein